jgi:hypothetical protein
MHPCMCRIHVSVRTLHACVHMYAPWCTNTRTGIVGDNENNFEEHHHHDIKQPGRTTRQSIRG